MDNRKIGTTELKLLHIPTYSSFRNCKYVQCKNLLAGYAYAKLNVEFVNEHERVGKYILQKSLVVSVKHHGAQK